MDVVWNSRKEFKENGNKSAENSLERAEVLREAACGNNRLEQSDHIRLKLM